MISGRLVGVLGANVRRQAARIRPTAGTLDDDDDDVRALCIISALRRCGEEVILFSTRLSPVVVHGRGHAICRQE